ncbi:hypothetical protein K1719_007952 [Acacia pycnantha]|nr:hypothetical protein K1719_007952 [Acacia pycnantha]
MGERGERRAVRTVRTEGDGRGRDDDGDGGGKQCDSGNNPVTGSFVFGSGGGMGSKQPQAQVGAQDDRRHVSLSYREKLLSPGNLGFLVSHEEADDIVKGWKGYFAKNHAEAESGMDGEDVSGHEDDMGDTPSSRYPVLSMTSEQYSSWCKPWVNSLIIKVLGVSVPKHLLMDRVRRMWKPKQPLKVVPLSNEYYIVSFSSKEDRDYAYYEGPWMIDDHYLLVQRWRPNFNPGKADCQRKVAVWVRIPDLPMELCTVESLGMIGNMIGKIIKIDRSTSIYDKGEFARICVEVDLQKPLLPAFTTFGVDKQIVYEGLHLVCFCCGIYGHTQEQCGKRKTVGEVKLSKDIEGGVGGSKQHSTGKEDVKGATVPSGSNSDAPTVQPVASSANSKTVTDEQEAEQGGSGRCVHLGPQMVFRRDLRRGDLGRFAARGLAKNEGVPKFPNGLAKNEEVPKARGVPKSGGVVRGNSNMVNGDGMKEKNQVGRKELNAAGLTSTIPTGEDAFRDLGKLKSEWVVIGSKRKKEERPKVFGKENKLGVRPKMNTKGMKKQVNHLMEVSNSYSSLQDPVEAQEQDTSFVEAVGPLVSPGPDIHCIPHDTQMDCGHEVNLAPKTIDVGGPNTMKGIDEGKVDPELAKGDIGINVGSGLAPNSLNSFK